MPGTKATHLQAAGDRRFAQRDWTSFVFGARLQRIDTLPLEDVKYIIQSWRRGEYAPTNTKENRDKLVRRGLECLLNNPPRDKQVEVLVEMLFDGNDVLLIAKTGFGKSIVFIAYGVLSGMTSLIIVPLTRLGTQQMNSINAVDGTSACLIDAETKYTNEDLLEEVGSRKYTHVVLGPEQAMAPEFKEILRDPDFQACVGLVAIDEIHLLVDWATFRTDYVLLHELRRLLPRHAVWFGCSATLTKTVEDDIKKMAGFRATDASPGLKVIRTTIDRPEISISIVQIRRHKKSDYSPLLFMFNDTVGAPKEDKASKIPKTVVFVDSHRYVNSIAEYLASSMARLDISSKLVSIYTSRVSEYDQDLIYSDFCSENASVRIVVATTALGMGMDMPDVQLVIQWGLPITESIADMWQRVGRAARGRGKKGKAVIFLPCKVWEKPKTTPANELSQSNMLAADREEVERSKKRKRNTMRESDQLISPAPTQLATPSSAEEPDSEAAELESNASMDSQMSLPSIMSGDDRTQKSTSTSTGKKKLKLGSSAAQRAHKAEESAAWYDMVISDCHRVFILKRLGEDVTDLDDHEHDETDECCSKCNSSIIPSVKVILPPPPKPPLRRPTPKSRAGIALSKIVEWCEKKAAELDLIKEFRYTMPGHVFMPTQVQITIASLFNKGRMSSQGDLRIGNVLMLRKVINADDWPYFESHAQDLIDFLHGIRDEVLGDHEKLAKKAMPPPSLPARFSQQSSQMSQISSSQMSQTPLSQMSQTPFSQRLPLTPLSALSQLSIDSPTQKRGRGRPPLMSKRDTNVRSPLVNVVNADGVEAEPAYPAADRETPSRPMTGEKRRGRPAVRGRGRGRPRKLQTGDALHLN